MIIFNAASFKKYEKKIKPGGQLFLNTSLVHEQPTRSDLQRIEVAANDIADNLGDSRVSNMVMLGAFVRQTGVVQNDSVIGALKYVLPAISQPLILLNVNGLQGGAEAFRHSSA
jgi:2-oxoglutarate ferredoxin oxidoreductase subunit gamma